ncbi:MAG: PCRF domain-containing protein [Oscillibacter sp.]
MVETYRAYQKCRTTSCEALELVSDPELKDMAQEELNTAKAEKERLFDELRVLLLPRDPNDDKNVIVEIRGGVGGRRARSLPPTSTACMRCTRKSGGTAWSCSTTTIRSWAVLRKLTLSSAAMGAYSRFKFESGVHRVQRVPETESGGRVHTSTATVAVLPEMEEVDVDSPARRH